MDFRSEMQKLAVQVSERKAHVANEEMTKQALIIPFLQKMGYDVFNPLEVRAEYVADFGIKKGEKVDYAIFKGGVPIIFIEAKPVTERLSKHSAQLSRYFNATPEVRIAILTNGIEYCMYTDLNQDNIMDSQPFFTFNLLQLTSVDCETLENFTEENFDAEQLVKYAEELVYMSNLNSTLKTLFRSPSDEFLRFLIKDFSNSRITNNVLERFRPIVKKAINNTLLEIISEGLAPKEVASTLSESIETEENPSAQNANEDTLQKKGVFTTEEELKSFDLVKEFLVEAERNIEDLNCKDTINYFTIYNRVITKWFLRINLDSKDKYIITRLPVEECKKFCPDHTVEQAPKNNGESRILIQSVDDLEVLKSLILACFDGVQ